jgi:NAD-dependent DNA ligase
VESLSEILLDRRNKSDFEIDGIVVTHDKIHNRVKENPSYAFAFKSLLTMERAEVIVSKVEWSLSKDAYLVPVIIFPGVALDGVTISRAHGFNGKFIQQNKIGPGSKIVIIRAGAVIPHVEEILSPSETGEASMPDVKYIWSKTGVDIMLSEEDKKESDDVKLKNIVNFFDKIDVKGFSTGNIKKLYDAGLKTVKAILTATKADLLKVDGFKDKMATKVYENLQEKMKELDCVVLIAASNSLGRGLGKTKIALLIEEMPNIIKQRYIPTLTEITNIKGFEKKTAQLFIDNMPKFWEFVDENQLTCFLDDKEVEPGEDAPEELGNNFTGEVFVFTGFRNAELEVYIKKCGGTVGSSITKKTTTLIRKDTEESSGKIDKAKELGVKIVTLSDFMKKNKINL